MSEKSKQPENSKKVEEHKKSTDASKIKEKVSDKSSKHIQKTGTKDDDWNDRTGNSHLSDKT
jgi:hypothetical protein